MHPDHHFSSDPNIRRVARELYQGVAPLPLVCPHSHVDPHLFSNPEASFGSPANLFIIPDHYLLRTLYSQGIPLEKLGIHPSSSTHSLPEGELGAELDHRTVWRTFCENFNLFRGTPSGTWLAYELDEFFDIHVKPSAANADQLYDQIAEKMALPEFTPRELFERFNIEVLCTTDAATDTLDHHRAIRQSGWNGRILPTFRPDAVVNLDAPNWLVNIGRLSLVSGIDVVDYVSFIKALEQRREFFKTMGATATDHDTLEPATFELSPFEADALLQSALRGRASAVDAARFTAHMLMEMARMSVEDGLVMQLHPGSLRNHNAMIYKRFGSDMGCDIPIQIEFTYNLLPLLNKYGNDPRLNLVLFTLDKLTYSLATLAGHYPAIKLGPPWWFHDSPNGMRRYFDQVMETAGLYNTAGFNDDTRTFCSIPGRHDVWRRASADWVAGLVTRHIVDMDDAGEMMEELAIGLVKRAYRL